ncbi:hypothetical protein [Sodalinema gerasimenkoae]|uniref:hypothetical protein n=1 Tax=Sodalinema gerasimenkoae TaxID=2862348 RepID=UPI0013571277|nr:hypothetical protein [Sodalinema gerasimenkoae]
MKPISITIHPERIIQIACGLVTLYLFFAFLPLPRPIGIGLDPSWKYGISQLAENNVIFGKDIIFTYGAFGYLVRGAVLESNFWDIFIFKTLVHGLLFAVTIWRMIKSKTALEQLAIAISVSFPYFISDFYEALQTEYQTLYIIVILLSFREIWQGKHAHYWAIGIGAVGGFLLHSKVSMGLQASASLFIFFAIQVLLGFRSRLGIRKNILLLLDSQLATASTAFLFLRVETLNNWFSLLISLIFSVLVGVAMVPKLLKTHPHLTPICQFTPRILYGVSLTAIILLSSPSLLDYLQGYSHITAGYSGGMSYIGSSTELAFVFLELLGLLWLLFLVAKDGNPSFSAAMVLLILLTFKHGFVRQGAHGLRFVFSMPLIVALCTLQIRPGFWQKFAYGVHLYSLILCLGFHHYYTNFFSDYYHTNLVRPLTPAIVAEKFSYFWNPSSLKADLLAQSEENLQAVTLPPEVREVIGSRSVDIIPRETSMVAANGLNWQPRPVFQSQAAYTPYLDNANRDSLANEPRDILLYNFHTVDARHPFFDAPATAFHYICHYGISPQVPQLVQLPALPNLMLLEPLSQSRCGQEQGQRELSVVWDDFAQITPEDGELVRASIEIEHSFWGRLAKSLFRVPPVYITVRDLAGEERTYRILVANAEGGVWLSHLPRHDGEAFELFQGQLPPRTYSFKFSTLNPGLFQPRIRVTLTGYGLGEFQERAARRGEISNAGN